MKRLVLIAMLSAALAACGGQEEKLAPVGSGAADAGDDAAPPSPHLDAGTVKRTVMTRNPLGSPAGNYLADGDFEMSTNPHAGSQLGWRAYASSGSGELDLATETGGLCHSGLRCAVMTPSMVLLITGASAKGKGNVASGWAKVPEGTSCSVVRPILITCDTFVVSKQLSAKNPRDADGWCHYATAITESDSSTCVYVDSTLKPDTKALLDAFVLGPDDGTVHPQAAEFWAPTAETVARLEAVRARVIATMPFGRPAPKRPLGP